MPPLTFQRKPALRRLTQTALLLCCLPPTAVLHAQQDDASPEVAHAQILMQRFVKDKDAVAYTAGIARLRTDLNSRAAAGRTVEATLEADAVFNDGTTVRKGTVLSGTVASAFNATREHPESTLTLDWTTAHISRKETLPIAAKVRDAVGGVPVQGADHTFGQNQLGATSNSGHAGDHNTTMNNSVLMNKQAGMPEIAPGVHIAPAGYHSMRVTADREDIVLKEGTRMVLVLFKDRALPQ